MSRYPDLVKYANAPDAVPTELARERIMLQIAAARLAEAEKQTELQRFMTVATIIRSSGRLDKEGADAMLLEVYKV